MLFEGAGSQMNPEVGTTESWAGHKSRSRKLLPCRFQAIPGDGQTGSNLQKGRFALLLPACRQSRIRHMLDTKE